LKKPHGEEEKENEDRWLLTYADLITLLMAFFVIMYALSRVDKEKFKAIAQSLASVFPVSSATFVPLPGIGGQKGTKPVSIMRKPPESPPTTPPGRPAEKTAMEKLADQFQQLVEAEGLGGSVTVSPSPSGRKLMVRLSESLLFEPGKAELAPQALELINKIAAIIAAADKPVRVEGHTDNVPISTVQFQSNWELSTARASSVIRYMIDKFHFTPELLSASGYGEYRPVAPNDTPEDRAKNRRVEFVITDKDEDA
jgi:chemotaxis protein MotB